MSVMGGTFPDTNGVFYMTVNGWCVWGSSRHRHCCRHRINALPKRLTRRRDGDDAHDGHLQAFSRQWRLYPSWQMRLLDIPILSHSSGSCPNGYRDDNLRHHCHHFWKGVGDLWWGREVYVFSCTY